MLREQIQQEITAALERLVTLLENQRAYTEGIRHAQRLLTVDLLAKKPTTASQFISLWERGGLLIVVNARSYGHCIGVARTGTTHHIYPLVI